MAKLKLNLEKPIVFFAQLAKSLGGIEEALYFQQLYFWSDKGINKDGWIWKTKKEIEEETTLTRCQQDRVRKKLEKMEVIETKIMKAKGSPTLHFRVNIGKVGNLLMEKQETYFSKSRKPTKPLTEITTESTTEDPSNAPGVASKDINNLIDLFKDVNPNYEILFKNKSQRAALERMVKKWSYERIENGIKLLPGIVNKPYAPRITTPTQLENKLADLVVFINQEKRKGQREKRIREILI